VRIRKKVEGIYSLVSQIPLVGYDKNKWYKILLLLNGQNFNFYMSKNYIFEPLTKIFKDDVVDEDLKLGLIGFSTFKTRAYFDDIELSPFDDLEKYEDLVYVDNKQLNLVPKSNPMNTSQNSIFKNLNKNIGNFTWERCIYYPFHDDRLKFCDVLFHSKK